ncbi:MAG: ABC transporter permease [Anaerolineaceae bacterium]|jgi:multidrug/hemolysin transport system permease protein
MNSIKNLSKRVVMIFFRDKSNVFYSLLASGLVFLIYLLFLGDVYADEGILAHMPNFVAMQNQWLIAGMLFITSFSSVLNAMGQLPYDKRIKISDDLLVAPLTRRSIVAGYMLGGSAAAFILSLVLMIFGYLYLFFKQTPLPDLPHTLYILVLVIVSILLVSSFAFLLAAYGKTPRSYGAVSGVLQTLVGFLAGVYLPLGTLGEGVKTLMTLLPTTHVVMLLRQAFTAGSFPQTTTAYIEGLRLFMGVDLSIGKYVIPVWVSWFYIGVSTLIMFLLSARKLSQSEDQ